jgi:hypothetical protein
MGSRVLASILLLASAGVLAGCPDTVFPDEGSGQPGDRASGRAPSSSVGACRLRLSRRPPVIPQELWNHLPECNKRSPRRYLRIGYSSILEADNDEALRLRYVMHELEEAYKEPDGNTRMILLTRAVQNVGVKDEKLKSRVERSTSRTFACDYDYLLDKTEKNFAKVTSDQCPAYVYDPVLRRDVCMFDMRKPEVKWLASSWACLAFTETAGEGESCHRMCEYDDYCASQVSCAQPDFDLILCSLGVCLPEEVAGLF